MIYGHAGAIKKKTVGIRSDIVTFVEPTEVKPEELRSPGDNVAMLPRYGIQSCTLLHLINGNRICVEQSAEICIESLNAANADAARPWWKFWS